jgi:diguanylate cyclase
MIGLVLLSVLSFGAGLACALAVSHLRGRAPKGAVDTTRIVPQQAPQAQDALLAFLDRTIANGQLRVHYQPKLDARTGLISGAEALLRLPALNGRPVDIEQIVGAAERSGHIRQLTWSVLEQVLTDGKATAAAELPLKLWINLSGQLLIDDALIGDLIAAIAASGADIGVEITETAVIADPDKALANMHCLGRAGIAIAIDDYGTGVSSLAYLKQMPVQELKIDRAFVADLTASNRNPLIIRSTIDLAHALDMTITAEGVDNAISQALLTVMGCDYLQGHHIGKPMPLADLQACVRSVAAAQAASAAAEPRSISGQRIER